MGSFKIAMLLSTLISVNAQDLTASTRANLPYNSYYSSGYNPNTKFKPRSSYKTIPPSYNPSDICFNPNLYGFFDTQTSPVPQPNIYYVPNNAQPASYPNSAWSAYSPWTWNNYPYLGNPATQFTSPSQVKSTSQMNLNLPRTSSPSTPQHRSTEAAQHNDTFKSSKTITITRPTITVKITPPSFNENATSVTNISPEPDTNTEQSSGNTRLNEGTRKMIKKLLEMGSRLASKYNEDDRRSSGNNARKDTTSSTPSGVDHRKNVESQPSPNNEMVILPHQQASPNNDNKYPLPKTVYGDTNAPTSSFDRMKILTEFNPSN